MREKEDRSSEEGRKREVEDSWSEAQSQTVTSAILHIHRTKLLIP